MEKLAISIIIPVYNVGEFISDCLDSIEEQTYKNFEVIMVDDGSSDNSGNICKSFTIRNPQFKYIQQTNQGVSLARNAGILQSKGEYIVFIDGDDWIDPSYLYNLITEIEQNNVDLVNQSYKKQSDQGEWEIEGYTEQIIVMQRDLKIWMENLLKNHTGPFPKIFKSSIIKKNKLFFRKDISFSEDLIFLLEYMQYAENGVAFSAERAYNYRYVATSLGNKYNNSELSYTFKPLLEILKILNSKYYSIILEDLNNLPQTRAKIINISMFMMHNLHRSKYSDRLKALTDLRAFNLNIFWDYITTKNILRYIFYKLYKKGYVNIALNIEGLRVKMMNTNGK